MTFSAVAADPKLLHDISEINEMQKNGRWLSTNLGIETVAPRMVKKHLGVKTKPFSTDEWGSVIIVAAGNQWFSFSILAPSLTTLPHSSVENGFVLTPRCFLTILGATVSIPRFVESHLPFFCISFISEIS